MRPWQWPKFLFTQLLWKATGRHSKDRPPPTWTTNAMATLMDSVLKEISCPVYCPINLQDVTTVTLNSQLFSAACPRISKEKTPPEGRDVCEQLRRILNPGPLLCVRQCWTPLPIQEAFQWRTCWLENRTAERLKQENIQAHLRLTTY